MSPKELFESFARGHLVGDEVGFEEVAWQKHAKFDGVELKVIIPFEKSGEGFSYQMVRIAPHCAIGLHTHENECETHEVIAGEGECIVDGKRHKYTAGTINILPARTPHEVHAGDDGLMLFAKFWRG
jgi:quercetin dioxygenase-like cupin family protein